MKTVQMRSRTIRSIAYDEANQLLEVVLVTGDVRRYPDAPKYLFLGLMSARSPSKFYETMVKERRFEQVLDHNGPASS